jgi:hypothetical protein
MCNLLILPERFPTSVSPHSLIQGREEAAAATAIDNNKNSSNKQQGEAQK